MKPLRATEHDHLGFIIKSIKTKAMIGCKVWIVCRIMYTFRRFEVPKCGLVSYHLSQSNKALKVRLCLYLMFALSS